MKRKLLLLGVFFFTLMLVGCTPAEKTFSKAGVTITLNESFVEKDVVQAPLYLESNDHIFMAIRESESDLIAFGITSLDSYIQAVLDNAGKSGTIKTFNEDGVNFKYAYYTSTVNDQEFGYMLITKKGANHYYTMNFGCLEKNLEENKDLYLDWAKTITVE